MPRITFSSRAVIYQGNPHDYREVHDPAVLKRYHGQHSEDEFCRDFIDRELVQKLGLKGGRLRFIYDEKLQSFRVTATYGIDRKPDPSELKLLQSETEGQWSDGIGGGLFSFLDEELFSATLKMAILNDDPQLISELPEHSVDSYPLSGDRNVQVSWSDQGGENDFLIHDLKVVAEKGDAGAQAELGKIFLEGELVPANPTVGLDLLNKSAQQKNDLGIVFLANAYLEGTGVQQDPAKAENLFNQAIQAGSPLAMSFLGEAYKEGKSVGKNPGKAMQLLTQASEMGFAPAMAELGDCYEFGLCTNKDLKAAHKWYHEALELGFEPVQPAYERVSRQLENSGGFFGRLMNMVSGIFGKKQVPEFDSDDPIVGVQGDDPEMQAAVQQAQATLDQFIHAVQNRKPGESPSIKVRFEDGDQVEYMWVNELRFENGYFVGRVNNEPAFVSNVKIGDEHQAHPNDVNDWLIIDEAGRFQGGFTIEVLQKRERLR